MTKLHKQQELTGNYW